MEQARKNNRNIYTALIYYKKAYDSVPHSWLFKIRKIYKINLESINFLSKKRKALSVDEKFAIITRLKNGEANVEVAKSLDLSHSTDLERPTKI
jgi:hypothetical protein